MKQTASQERVFPRQTPYTHPPPPHRERAVRSKDPGSYKKHKLHHEGKCNLIWKRQDQPSPWPDYRWQTAWQKCIETKSSIYIYASSMEGQTMKLSRCGFCIALNSIWVYRCTASFWPWLGCFCDQGSEPPYICLWEFSALSQLFSICHWWLLILSPRARLCSVLFLSIKSYHLLPWPCFSSVCFLISTVY